MEAAFFDLDKTVISRASIMAFAKDFRRAGMLPRRAVAKGLWTQLWYVRFGASAGKVERVRRSVLSVTRGWDQQDVRQLVTARLAARIDPITFADARRLIDDHHRAGRVVYLVSAAPAEVVDPVAIHLGADGAVASRASIDPDGRYTGELECYAYGPMKARLLRALADEEGIDLARSFAYSDSATDVPMLEAVGHPAAVNPDRALRRVAEDRGWEILRFADYYREEEVEPVALVTPRKSRWARPASIAAGAAAAIGGAAALGGATALAWRRYAQPAGSEG